MKYQILWLLALSVLVSCSDDKNKSDAFGNFEAVEIIVSSEATGKIRDFNAEEGTKVEKGQIIGVIDTVQLNLKKSQLSASINALSAKTRDTETQIDVLTEQKANLVREYDRLKRLYKDSAATRKQLEDMEGQIKVVDKNIIATKRSLSDANRGILSEQKPLAVQIDQLKDNLEKSYIVSPIGGTILKKYAEAGEIVTFGKPLFKMASLDDMILRVYVSGTMLSQIKTGNSVKVRIDKNAEEFIEYAGTIEWISDKAEFTPKIVQTKQERVNLVYAVKIAVKNDGKLKIGMPGEVKFSEIGK